MKLKNPLSDRDIKFLADTVSPEVRDKPQVKRIIQDDDDFRNTDLADERVFRKLLGDEEKERVESAGSRRFFFLANAKKQDPLLFASLTPGFSFASTSPSTHIQIFYTPR